MHPVPYCRTDINLRHLSFLKMFLVNSKPRSCVVGSYYSPFFLHYRLVSRLETINIGKTGKQNHPDLEVSVALVTCFFNIDFW